MMKWFSLKLIHPQKIHEKDIWQFVRGKSVACFSIPNEKKTVNF